MENKKGQMDKLGMIVILAVVLIFGAVFATTIANEQSNLTDLREATNETYTFPNVNESITLSGQAVDGSVTVTNGTGTTIDSGNYTVEDFVQTNGEYRATLTADDSEFSGQDVNLTYTYEPVGYNSDSGSRSTATLPLLFFVLALLAVAIKGISDWLNQ